MSEIAGVALPPLLDGHSDRILEDLSKILMSISKLIDACDAAIAESENELLEAAKLYS